MHKYKITGYTLDDYSAYSSAERIDYSFVVELSSWMDHEEIVDNYLECYSGIDLENEKNILHQLRSNEICATAIVVFYFRKQFKKLLDRHLEYYSEEPKFDPVEEGENYKLWILADEKSKVITEKQAAGELIERCRYRKISPREAKGIIRSEYPELNYNWDKVLSHFQKLGGKHTKLYLRYE